jgi:CubicO group peptidase (beta-lactamase class C family)
MLSIALLLMFGIWGQGAAAAEKPAASEFKPDQFLKSWLILKPISVARDGNNSPDEAAQKTAFAKDWLTDQGGESSIRPQSGVKQKIGGTELEWQPVNSKSDVMDLKGADAASDYAIAYAWCEVDAPQKTKAFLGIGSDDAVKVWLNGKLVHENWVGRQTKADDDIVAVELERGKNQLLLKVQNQQGDWSFICRALSEKTQAGKLITAVMAGAEIEAVKALLDRGLDVNSRGPAGITAVMAAKLRGETAMVEYLASRGADLKAPIPPRENLADALFRTVLKDPSGAGIAVLVAEDGKVLLEKGYGLADIEHKTSVTPETKFRIGSITKQFTAAAILKLQEEGKLSVTDKLYKYIPDFPRGDEVTLHHLLTHTSGIRSYTDKPGFIDHVTNSITSQALIDSFKHDPYDFDPGKKWHYDNSGFFLLGYIVQKVSGQPYDEFLKQKFFEPLGMTSTGVYRTGLELDHEALGYRFQGEGFVRALNWDMSWAGGAGAIYSTVEDLKRWNEALFHGKVLNEAGLKAAFTPGKTEENKDDTSGNGYGYGWAIAHLRGAEEISHGGGLDGFSTYLLRLPKQNFTVAVLANALPGAPGVDPSQLAHLVTEIYLGDKLEPRPTPAANPSVSPQALQAIVGRYDYGNAIMTVTREGTHVYAQPTGQPRFEIFPKSETDYFWKVTDAQVSFVKDSSGKVTKAVHHQSGMTINAPRLEDVTAVKMDPASFDALTGKYDYGEGKTILTVTREGDRLFAQLTGQPKFEIFPKSATEFYWKVVNAQITFVKDDTGKVTKVIHQQGGRRFEAPRVE